MGANDDSLVLTINRNLRLSRFPKIKILGYTSPVKVWKLLGKRLFITEKQLKEIYNGQTSLSKK